MNIVFIHLPYSLHQFCVKFLKSRIEFVVLSYLNFLLNYVSTYDTLCMDLATVGSH